MTPRLLVSGQRADALEERWAEWGGLERHPLVVEELLVLLGEGEQAPSPAALEDAFDLSISPETDEAVSGAERSLAELAADNLEWVTPLEFADLPDVVHRRALEKYAPYRDWQEYPPIFHYHVSRDGPFRVLHYWFLYAYNDWAAHGGMNDHEGDWEVIFVFLDEADRPQHVAYSRHARIPWFYEPTTAPWSEVERVREATSQATHPVVYVGCGSHASYLTPDKHPLLWLRDYALGNDQVIGPGADQDWGRPVRLGDKPWNLRYAGKWGSLVKSWLGVVRPGTLGPTGPAQKGSKWSHPTRWAGLL